jgi:predicted dehydrogenase
MSQLNRRQFLNRSLTAAGVVGAGFAIGGTKSSGRVLGANDTIRIGVAGLNGRGESHVGAFSNMKGVEIAYLIDPDTRTYASRIKQIERRGGSTPQTVQDIRRALDDKNLDAVSVATPNHWHALITIWACQAGKDVYVEKPCSHNVHEGRIAVEAARKHDRIVQHGTQSRSEGHWARTVAVVRSGQLGKLLVARALCYKPRPSIGFKPNATPPEQIDFNLWLGPAPERPFNTNLVHYNWHWFWDFGNGDIGNQGVHQMDIARWMIPGATLPKSATSIGGRFGYKDQGETANTQITLFDFGDTQLIFEVRGLKTDGYLGQKVGNIAHLEGGTIVDNKFYPKGSSKAAPLPKVDSGPRRPGDSHFANFIAAVRSRKTDDLNADILEGHYSSALCHLANVSYRLGTEAPFHAKACAFGDNTEAYEALGRMEEHLSGGNRLALEDQTYRVGRKLTVDAKAESIVNDSEANALLTRHYRKPFAVPDKIA